MANETSDTDYFSNVTSASVQFHAYYAFSTDIVPPLKFHQSTFFIITVLITFLQLMYQGSDKNPFTSHPRTMGVAICALLVYYLACSGQLTFPLGRFSAASVTRRCMLWSGNVSVASLASLFAPDSVRPLLYAVFVFVCASDLVHWLCKKILDCGRDSYYRGSWYFPRFFSRVAPNSLVGRARILPR